MGSYILGEPLGSPMPYDPSFKVEACLDEPLWWSRFDTSTAAFRVMTICSQLEMLCHKEVMENPEKHAEQGNLSSSFEAKGYLLLEKLKNQALYLPDPNISITDYLQQTGLANLYPRATNYVLNPKQPTLSVGPTEMDGYFQLMGKLKNLISLSSQIHTDVANRANLKYIPHQLALLHQSVAAFSSNATMTKLKKDIEDNFDTVKATLSRNGANQNPQLPDSHADWLRQLTQALMDEALSLPADMTEVLLPAASLITNLA